MVGLLIIMHLTVEWAFALCSCVSVLLVVSYSRLVVSTRFATREAAGTQLLYLIGFSLAHSWEGFTGLTGTVLAIVTLFALNDVTCQCASAFLAQCPGERRIELRES